TSSLDGSGISPAGKQGTPSLDGPETSPAGKNQLSPEEEKNRDLFEKMPIPRALAAMAVPTVISQLIVLIYNMADTFYIGRTNNPYMVAGAALILPIFNVCIAVANIAGTGGGTLIARLMGAKDPKSARRVASFSIWFSVFFALFFSVMTAVFMRQLLTFLGASPQTFDYARQYCTCVIVVGAVPTITAMTMGNLLRNVGCSRQAGLAISMGGILNIILDPLFMFVLLPPGHEILGAGIATALSNTITCTNFICLILRLHNPILHFSLREGLPVREHLASFFGVGIPAALGPFLFDLDYIFLDRLMAAHSDIALAAIGIVLKAERLPLNVGIGLCLGMVPLAAYNYSAGNLPRMQSVLRATRLTGIVIGLASIALYEFFAPNLIRIFIGDAATVALGSDFLRIRALATIMMFLSFIYVYYFQALGHGRVGLFLVVMRWLMINIPMLFLLDRLFGLYGLAWSQFVSDTIVALLSWMIYRLYSAKRIRQLQT
ncbi:MAG: MATE family efflux transporter, partial [Eubacteriales bacterium]|nr:MATE family efflux transporter [Eubacteriales bacterium]